MKHRDDAVLYDYQREMKSRLYASWEEARSVMCQMPTGTGKTHLLVSVVRDYVRSGRNPVWIVVHRIELVEQISATLSRYGVPHGRIVSGAPRSGEAVQVVSIQTLSSLIERGKLKIGKDQVPHLEPEEVQAPGLLVIDEAHHAPAKSYLRLWALFPDAYKLGMTATPCRLNRSGFTSLFARLLTSWPVSRFIEEERLALFDYLSIRPDSELQRLVDSLSRRGADGDYSLKEMGLVLDRPDAIEQLYRSYKEFADGKKGIIYAINRSHSLHILDCYRSRGVRIVAIDSHTPSAERRECVERYTRGEIDVLVNVDIFSEGFDCPDVEFIQLARPTLSLSKYLQQVGRGLRVHPSKVRTVILDHAGLYLRFGLPSDERDWQRLFLGVRSGKEAKEEESAGMLERAALLERQCETPCSRLSSLGMSVVQGYEDFLRQAANRRAEVEPFEQDGLYGLRKGDEILLAPSYPLIGPFTGNYAVVGYACGRYGLITKNANVLPLPKSRRIELYAGELAYIEESPVVRYYIDLKTFERYEKRPELFMLDFLEFVYDGSCYSLRMRRKGWKVVPCFTRDDLHIEGDLFFHKGIFIHRSFPSEVYWYEFTDKEGNLIGSDRNENLYLCPPCRPPVYYGVKKWMKKTRRWAFVERRGKDGCD